MTTRAKLDENFGSRGQSVLRAAGWDVATVHAQDLSGARDLTLIEVCCVEKDARAGKLRFLEVKGRDERADVITVKNEILEFRNDDTHRVHYVRRPFRREPDFGVTSVNYDFAELLARAEAPQ